MNMTTEVMQADASIKDSNEEGGGERVELHRRVSESGVDTVKKKKKQKSVTKKKKRATITIGEGGSSDLVTTSLTAEEVAMRTSTSSKLSSSSSSPSLEEGGKKAVSSRSSLSIKSPKKPKSKKKLLHQNSKGNDDGDGDETSKKKKKKKVKQGDDDTAGGELPNSTHGDTELGKHLSTTKKKKKKTKGDKSVDSSVLTGDTSGAVSAGVSPKRTKKSKKSSSDASGKSSSIKRSPKRKTKKTLNSADMGKQKDGDDSEVPPVVVDGENNTRKSKLEPLNELEPLPNPTTTTTTAAAAAAAATSGDVDVTSCTADETSSEETMPTERVQKQPLDESATGGDPADKTLERSTSLAPTATLPPPPPPDGEPPEEEDTNEVLEATKPTVLSESTVNDEEKQPPTSKRDDDDVDKPLELAIPSPASAPTIGQPESPDGETTNSTDDEGTTEALDETDPVAPSVLATPAAQVDKTTEEKKPPPTEEVEEEEAKSSRDAAFSVDTTSDERTEDGEEGTPESMEEEPRPKKAGKPLFGISARKGSSRRSLLVTETNEDEVAAVLDGDKPLLGRSAHSASVPTTSSAPLDDDVDEEEEGEEEVEEETTKPVSSVWIGDKAPGRAVGDNHATEEGEDEILETWSIVSSVSATSEQDEILSDEELSEDEDNDKPVESSAPPSEEQPKKEKKLVKKLVGGGGRLIGKVSNKIAEQGGKMIKKKSSKGLEEGGGEADKSLEISAHSLASAPTTTTLKPIDGEEDTNSAKGSKLSDKDKRLVKKIMGGGGKLLGKVSNKITQSNKKTEDKQSTGEDGESDKSLKISAHSLAASAPPPTTTPQSVDGVEAEGDTDAAAEESKPSDKDKKLVQKIMGGGGKLLGKVSNKITQSGKKTEENKPSTSCCEEGDKSDERADDDSSASLYTTHDDDDEESEEKLSSKDNKLAKKIMGGSCRVIGKVSNKIVQGGKNIKNKLSTGDEGDGGDLQDGEKNEIGVNNATEDSKLSEKDKNTVLKIFGRGSSSGGGLLGKIKASQGGQTAEKKLSSEITKEGTEAAAEESTLSEKEKKAVQRIFGGVAGGGLFKSASAKISEEKPSSGGKDGEDILKPLPLSFSNRATSVPTTTTAPPAGAEKTEQEIIDEKLNSSISKLFGSGGLLGNKRWDKLKVSALFVGNAKANQHNPKAPQSILPSEPAAQEPEPEEQSRWGKLKISGMFVGTALVSSKVSAIFKEEEDEEGEANPQYAASKANLDQQYVDHRLALIDEIEREMEDAVALRRKQMAKELEDMEFDAACVEMQLEEELSRGEELQSIIDARLQEAEEWSDTSSACEEMVLELSGENAALKKRLQVGRRESAVATETLQCSIDDLKQKIAEMKAAQAMNDAENEANPAHSPGTASRMSVGKLHGEFLQANAKIAEKDMIIRRNQEKLDWMVDELRGFVEGYGPANLEKEAAEWRARGHMGDALLRKRETEIEMELKLKDYRISYLKEEKERIEREKREEEKEETVGRRVTSFVTSFFNEDI